MYIEILQNILLRENLAKGIKCINNMNSLKTTHQKQHLHPELDVIN